jgi:hypothetical protein
VALLGSISLSGCVVVADDDDPPLGTLTVEWTIEGLTDPADCAAFGVDRLELRLYVDVDRFVEEVEPLCESFAVSLDLVEGRYFADATLVDSFDRSATVSEPIDDILVVEGTELVVSLDFPFDSFL